MEYEGVVAGYQHLFNLNASSFNQEANIEQPSFYVSLEGDFSSCDTNDEK